MKKYRWNICLLIVFVMLQLSAWAQTSVDAVIFRAMQDELQRNKEQLKLPGYGTPFFLAYSLKVVSNFEVSGSLGAVTNSFFQDRSVVGNVRLLTGDYHRTNDFMYEGGNGIRTSLPADLDGNEIRRNFWMATDAAYKMALQQYASKQAYLKSNPKSAEEEQVDDFSNQKVTDRIVTEEPAFQFDQKLWEKQIARLSAIFSKYSQLQNSSVTISGLNSMIYKVNTDGLKIKEPLSQVTLSATASVIACDGVKLGDNWSLTVAAPQDLPSVEELEKRITEFAENLMRLSQLEPIKEYYAGPVLFEKGACVQVFRDNLLRSGQLMAWRKPEGKPSRLTFDGRIERKILDGRLTVKNYTALKSYNGTSLLGHYEIDAEGIAPEKELVLIESGILRRQLNGRIPTLKAPLSTGSSRFSLAPNQVSFATAPGTIHIAGKDGLKPEKMKKALLKAAAEENLKYAYIVRKMAGQASLIYRVDTKTGEETQVRAGDFAGIDLMKLKRLREISAREQVVNYLFNGQQPASMICPEAVLMEDVEMNVPQLRKEKKDALTFPLQRTQN